MLVAVLIGAWAGSGARAQATEPASSSSTSSSISSDTIEAALAKADRLILVGQPVDAFVVLRQTMEKLPKFADTTALRFGIAQALMAGGRYAQAEQVLEQLAKERPDNLRVRLDRAAVLVELGRDDEAEVLFRELRRKPNLPPDARRRVEEYLANMRDRQPLRIDFDLGIWHDANVNGAAEVESVAIPAFFNLVFDLNERPVEAWVLRTGVKLNWRKVLEKDRPMMMETQASVVRNTALGAQEYNRTWLTLSTGVRMDYATTIAGSEQPGWITPSMGLERRWQGANGVATSLWGQLGVEQTLNPNWLISVAPRLWLTRHDGQPSDANPIGRSLDLSVTRLTGPGRLTLGGTLSRERAGQRSLNWRSQGFNLEYAYAAGVRKEWSGSVRLGVRKTQFDAVDGTFLVRRKDRARTVGMTLSHRKFAWEGYQPMLILDWSRTRSNIALYERKVLSASVGFERLF